MKKLTSLAVTVLLLVSLSAFAAETLTLLSGANATGPGSAAAVGSGIYKTWACDIVVTGSPTAVTVRIEGNQGGTLFDPTGMATHTCTSGQLAAGICSFGFDSMPALSLRANIITLTAGTNPTVTVRCTGVQ